MRLPVPIWIADAHRDNGKRFVVRADEKVTAFLEREAETTKPKFVVFNCFNGTLFRYFKDASYFEIEELRSATEEEGFTNGKLQCPTQGGRHP